MPKYRVTLLPAGLEYITEARPEWNDEGRTVAFCGGRVGNKERKLFLIALGDNDTVIIETDAKDA